MSGACVTDDLSFKSQHRTNCTYHRLSFRNTLRLWCYCIRELLLNAFVCCLQGRKHLRNLKFHHPDCRIVHCIFRPLMADSVDEQSVDNTHTSVSEAPLADHLEPPCDGAATGVTEAASYTDLFSFGTVSPLVEASFQSSNFFKGCKWCHSSHTVNSIGLPTGHVCSLQAKTTLCESTMPRLLNPACLSLL